ncbi:MAG: CsgG/HfaB family protein [Phycisphaerae bacterium]|nr:CsgG/HfaB family protein [Phycisphaerae bacterium]MDD5381282.1 CsgG/HfaB family protein [Phycisphaerae bacterium]
MKKALLFLTILALACPQVFSADPNTTKTVETKGRGVSRDEAINNALRQAVAQVKGVAISSINTDFSYRSASADIEKTPSGKKVEFDAVGVDTGGTTLRTDVAGLVKTYEVLNEKKLDDGTYEVTLKVAVFDYESPEKSARLKLAVMPIRTLTGFYQFGNILNPSLDTSRLFSQKLTAALTQTNKFNVLDREYMQEFAQERNFLLSGDASMEEMAKLGEALGVDYMLVGTINRAGIVTKESYSQAIGRTVTEYEAHFSFEYRLIVGPTRQVKLAGVLDIALDKVNDIKKLVKKWEPQDLDWKELTDNFIGMAANQMVDIIIDNLYPIRIASIDKDGQVIINQGGSRIAVGQLLDIVSQGKELFDADTRESLGTTETLVATIRIDKVMPKISYAKVIEGDLAKLSEGLICRLKKTGAAAPVEGRKSEVQKSPTGGVKLPFD